MHHIERAFGKNLPIATLFHAPTIEQLATILRQKGWSPRWSSLVAIQGRGLKPPFFCVHGIEANVLRFLELAQYLGSDQPFYGLQAQGLNAIYPCHTRAEDMAAHYIKEIRNVQSEGPYHLGGYSFGGMIALEMAQQLISQGQEVSMVVLFDTFCTPARKTPTSQIVASISSALINFFRRGAPGIRTYCLRIVTAPARAVRRWLHVARMPRTLRKVRKACVEAAQHYTPRGYAGRVILFRSSYKPIMRFTDPHAGWTRYATCGLEIYEVEGNHENILLKPTVEFEAERLKTCLYNPQEIPPESVHELLPAVAHPEDVVRSRSNACLQDPGSSSSMAPGRDYPCL